MREGLGRRGTEEPIPQQVYLDGGSVYSAELKYGFLFRVILGRRLGSKQKHG